jgi:hypothetical protein
MVFFHCLTEPSVDLAQVHGEQGSARAGSLFVNRVNIYRKSCLLF